MTEVCFPTLSQQQPDAEGVLSTWFVRDGEAVTAEELIAEVMVDKVSAEVTAPCAGVITLLAKEDEAVRQGTPIATIS